jgi:hypothetical protein
LKPKSKYIMRKLLSSLFVLCTLHVFGQVTTPQSQPQQPPPNQQQPPPGGGPTFIVAVQMGTDTLKNGKVVVKLADETLQEMKQAMASPDYTVMLTPRGECGQLNVIEKTAATFTIKQQKGSATADGIFDYIIFVKQRRPMMPMHPHPPAPQQPPAQQAPPAPPTQQ